ncbi:TPA: hypothetical protein NG603_004454 [Vibrio parahaemolyticus]|nr:hypothetical protein [Vibrio parahaemolyticus]
MNKSSIIEAIKVGEFTSDELNSLNELINFKRKKIEQSNKVKIFSLDHCDTTQFFMTAEEVKAELLSEIQSCDASDIVGVEFNVSERYVAEIDLPEYIGKLYI